MRVGSACANRSPPDGKKNLTWHGLKLSQDDRDTYTVDSIHTWAAFSSSSTDEHEAFSGNTRCVIKPKHGKDIRAYSAVSREAEVLLRAGTKVRVTEESERIDGVLHIHVEEVDDGEV